MRYSLILRNRRKWRHNFLTLGDNSLEIRRDGSNGFRLDGVDASDFSGYSVSSAGDVNGDGFSDVIIGAHAADPDGKDSAGESYVVFGKSSGWSSDLDLSSLNGSNGFRLDGVDQSDQSGYSVSSAGDVNGDGYGDVIIGANGADPDGNSGAGKSYVVFGKSSGFSSSLDLSSLDGSNGFRLDGVDANDWSGRSVSSAGDVNGDGYGDVIIGAYRADPDGKGSAGESYVVFGKSSGFSSSLDLSSLDGSNGFRLDGVHQSDQSGYSVSSAGDVNGDGYDDVIIGAFGAEPDGNSGAGESYVVFGNTGGWSSSLDFWSLDGSNGFRLDGVDADDLSGNSVSSAGDVNGDGFDDVIIGAGYANPDGKDRAGESYVVFGGQNGWMSTFSLTGVDAEHFEVDLWHDLLKLKSSVSADFETKTSFSVTVVATDADNNNLSQDFVLNVSAINEAPTDILLSADTVFENSATGTVIGDLSAIDPEDNLQSFSLFGGTGYNFFEINSLNQLVVKSGAVLDFDTHPSPTVIIRAKDDLGLSYDQTLTVSVMEATELINQAPTDITLDSLSVAENSAGAHVANIAGTDPDGDALTYSIVGGADAALFEISVSGDMLHLATGVSADYEADSQMDVQLQATDPEGLTYQEGFTIDVIDTNDAPVLISPVGNQTILEDQYFVFTTAQNFLDVDHGDYLTFSAASSDGSVLPSWLVLNTSTGILSGTPLNADVGLYQLYVSATDSQGAYVSDLFDLTVINTNDAPTITSALADAKGVVTEDAVLLTTATGTLTASDVDGDNLTFSVASPVGTYGTLAIDAASAGAWTYTLNNSDPDTDSLSQGEAVTDTITVTVSDGKGGSATEDVVVTITGSNDGPIITSAAAVNVPENSVSVLTVSASDVDSSQFQYSIVDGDDQGKFTIDSSGVLTFKSAPDYEAPGDVGEDNDYQLTVSVSDGDASTADQQAITVTIGDVMKLPPTSP